MPQPLTTERTIAFDSYIDVLEAGISAKDALKKQLMQTKKSATKLNHQFIHELLYGSLRWHSKLYWILNNTSKRDLDTTNSVIKAALVCGTYQIFYMEKVPDRVAVSESVEFTRNRGNASACPFVNGILRQIARRAEYFPKPNKTTHQNEYLALQYAHPKWLVDKWSESFRLERMEAILGANNSEAPYALRVNMAITPTENVHQLQQELLKNERTHTVKRPLRSCLNAKELPKTYSNTIYQKGFYSLQSETDQLAGYLINPQPADAIAFTNAGNGDSAALCIELSNSKVKPYIFAQSGELEDRLKENLQRLGHGEKYELSKQTFTESNVEDQFDKVFCSPPSSKLGKIRSHPEAKWQVSLDSLKKFAEIQLDSLTKALSAVKDNGLVIYYVPSFEPEESTHHLDELTRDKKIKFELLNPSEFLPDYYNRFVTRNHILLIYPGSQEALQGMSAFILKKLPST